MAKSLSILLEKIVCEEQSERHSAFHDAKELCGGEIYPVLFAGLEHWDRSLRNKCAKELVHRMGVKALYFLIPYRIKNALYASCVEGLFDKDDPRLIAELKLIAKTGTKDVAAFVKRLIPPPPPPHWRSCWHWFGEYFPLPAEIDADCAAYIRMHWAKGKDMDDLYHVTSIPKRSGGMRQIEEPCPALKVLQRGILEYVLGEARLHGTCHGFRKKHSIISNAAPHIGKDVVLNLDLKDFFPSISANRVYGIYKRFVGEGPLARFLTEASVFDGRLPQGAPTSPMLANLTCCRLDSRLEGIAKKIGADYTRYADDLTFSGPESILRYIPVIRRIISEESLTVSLPKLRIHRKGARQEVTGLTVNRQVSVPRAIRRRLRAAVHSASNGRQPTWKGQGLSQQSLKGHIHFVASVHPELGAALLKKALVATRCTPSNRQELRDLEEKQEKQEKIIQKQSPTKEEVKISGKSVPKINPEIVWRLEKDVHAIAWDKARKEEDFGIWVC